MFAVKFDKTPYVWYNFPMKKSGGFSYLEVLVALALFAIAIIAIIPVLTQAGRNMIYAEKAYDAHLQAQRMMLVIRDALIDGKDPEIIVPDYTNWDFEFSFWVNGVGTHSTPRSGADADAIGSNTTMVNHATTIIVVAWSEDGYVAGRAISMLYPR